MGRRMRKYLYILTVLGSLALGSLASCDSGPVDETIAYVPQEGRTVKVTGTFEGMDSWPGGYTVAVAGFSHASEYAVVAKNIAVGNGEVQTIMSGVSEEVSEVEVCVIDRLRVRVATFAVVENINELADDTIRLDVGTLDVGMFNTVQQSVFNANCIACHGMSNEAARGLYLTEGRSYDCLVDRQSSANPEYLLVNPGNSAESFLHLVLHDDGYLSHGHTDILSAKTELLNLIDDWIDNGAKQ